MSSFLLPEGMLDYFDVVRIDEEARPGEELFTGGVLHIYLDELDNRAAATAAGRLWYGRAIWSKK